MNKVTENRIDQTTENQISKVQANHLQESLMRIYHAGLSLQAINRVLIEIQINEDSICDDFREILPTDKGLLVDSVALLGRLVEYETYDIAKRFGLKEPA